MWMVYRPRPAEALVCYCFLHPRSEIESELRHDGISTLLDRIAAKVKAGECACEVRNPSGRCCLGEVRAEIARLAGLFLFERCEPDLRGADR